MLGTSAGDLRLHNIWPTLKRSSALLLRKALNRGGVEATLLILLVVTVGAIHFKDAVLTRNTMIDPRQTEVAARYSFGDQTVKGTSVPRMDDKQALSGTCSVKSGYSYPFCGLGLLINVHQQRSGFDASDAEKISVELSYSGPGKTISLSLKSYNELYDREGVANAGKVNQVSFPIKPGRQVIEVMPGDFSVAQWWIDQVKASRDEAQPQFDNVVAIEVQTGAEAALGTHKIQVHSIEITHRVFTAGQLYTALAFLWIAALFRLTVVRRVEAEQIQRALAERGHKMLDAIPQMVWAANEHGYEYYNRQWETFSGLKPHGAERLKRLDLVHPDDRATAAELWKQSVSSGEPYECEYRLLHRSGEYRWVLSRATPDLASDGRSLCWYGTCTDIHDRVIAAEALDASERLTQGIAAAIPDCVSLLSPDGRRIFVNDATVQAHGMSGADQLLGELFTDRIAEPLRELTKVQLRHAQQGKLGRATVSGADGRWWDVLIAPICGATGRVLRIVIISRDVTEQKNAEERAKWSAAHDALTKLPNRTLMQEKLDDLVALEGPAAEPFALVLLDIDNFKRINDSGGHDAGDALLCTFAERLRDAVRPSDTVARLSGDEFALLLPGISGETELKIILDRIQTELRKPCVHAGRVFDSSASIGAGIYGRHGSTSVELLKNVDVALYAAKSAGRANSQIFRSALRNEMKKRSSMLVLAKDAIRDSRILPYYQPKVHLASRQVVGFEALLRWREPNRGIQPPSRIAAAFEDTTLAGEISDQIIDGVLADLVAWRRRGFSVPHVAVNASAAEFRRGNFAERLLEKLHRAAVPVSQLQLEVTETVFLGRGAECVEHALKTLSGAGMKIALDDFGTGYASLAHLSQFPVNILKVDRSFVSKITAVSGVSPIIEAVINLGRSLDMEVVTEGIETKIQQDSLIAAGCLQGQGYLYSPAVPANRVPKLLCGLVGSERLAA